MKDDFALLADWTSQLGFLAEDLDILREFFPEIFDDYVGEDKLKELFDAIDLAERMKKKYDLPEYNEDG